MPAKGTAEIVRRGDVVLLQPPGSGGYGDPKRRGRERLLDDLRDGYVTKAALAGYGLSPAEIEALAAEAAHG